MKFSTYQEFARWLVENDHRQCLVDIITDSLPLLPGDPHLKTSMMIFLDQVLTYLHSGMRKVPSAPFGAEGNLEAFFEVWLFLDCPGFNDEVVVRRGKEWGVL